MSNNENIRRKIGQNIAKVRQNKGLSLRQLALLSEMEHHQILKIENGGDFKISTLIKLSIALETDLKFFLDVSFTD